MSGFDPLRDTAATLSRRLPRLRRPAYTGTNRCWPCTVINAALVVALALALASFSRIVAVVALFAGGTLVALRGYVVPGTPRFAPKLVASLPLPVSFGHTDPGVDSGTLAGDVDPEAVLEHLIDCGVVRAGDTEVYLTDGFREAWEDRMADLRGGTDSELAKRVARAAGDDIEAQIHGERLLLAGGRDVWLSRAVAIAETAAVETLAEWDVPQDLRGAAAQPLRTFVRTCPVCGGSVHETTLQNCCGGPGSVFDNPERAALACADCDATVFVFDRATAQ